jgi:hypothetical protein
MGGGMNPEDIDQTEAMLSVMCLKNAAGKFCYSSFMTSQNFAKIDHDCPEEPSGNKPCNATCRADVNALIEELGCCVTSIINIQKDASGIKTWLGSQCQATLPVGCVRAAVKAAVRSALTNVRYSWYTGHKQQFEDAYKADLSTATGIAADDIEITSVAELNGLSDKSAGARVFAASASSGVVVFASLSCSSDSEATQVQNNYNAAVADNSLTFNAIGALPSDSRQIASAAVGIDKSKSTAATCTTNCDSVNDFPPDAAFSTVPAVFVALVTLVAALFRL